MDIVQLLLHPPEIILGRADGSLHVIQRGVTRQYLEVLCTVHYLVKHTIELSCEALHAPA